jgi:hypothetical protein
MSRERDWKDIAERGHPVQLDRVDCRSRPLRGAGLGGVKNRAAMNKSWGTCSGSNLDSVGQEVPITDLRHPAGSTEMALHSARRSAGFLAWIDAEDDIGHFILACTIGTSVKKPKIDNKVGLVIGGK